MEIALLTVVGSIGLLGFPVGLYCFWRMRQWERQLAGARIAVFYKRRVKLQAPLIDWMQWAMMLHKDQQSQGRTVYQMGQTTVVIAKPQPQGKTKTRTVKEKQAA